VTKVKDTLVQYLKGKETEFEGYLKKAKGAGIPCDKETDLSDLLGDMRPLLTSSQTNELLAIRLLESVAERSSVLSSMGLDRVCKAAMEEQKGHEHEDTAEEDNAGGHLTPTTLLSATLTLIIIFL
jgi:hypothetical protein